MSGTFRDVLRNAPVCGILNKIMKEFRKYLKELTSDPRICRMKDYISHGRVSTYAHCVRVAHMSYRIDRVLHLCSDKRALIRGAMLHDYYLYDWHHWRGELHGFYHPVAAARNAHRDFHLTEKERNIIESHMWPLTLTRVPRSREAAIVCVADKICSLKETLFERKRKS